jgi:hypothetical protein
MQVKSYHSRNIIHTNLARSLFHLFSVSASADFFLFGYIKQRTAGQEFTSPNELID